MTLVSHPTGNTFVRALLRALDRSGEPFQYHTTLGFSEQAPWLKWLPFNTRDLLSRRSYDLPASSCHAHPMREITRLILNRLLSPSVVERKLPRFAPREIYRQLDLEVAHHLISSSERFETLHAYEDGAYHSFQAAAQLGMRRCYHLPIAYWATSQRLLQEEVQRWPEWAPTLGEGLTNADVAAQKSAELETATDILCPSEFVLRSLPDAARHSKRCVVAPFGSPQRCIVPTSTGNQIGRPLRVLFAGSFTQRKGLADLFAAMKQLRRPDVELILAGTPILPLQFYRQQYAGFRYEPARSHPALLELMGQCDLLVLPSLVEGRALVQQEALSCGLPILITPNTGGEDLIEPGTGFLVPIRQPEGIAERIDWLADHRGELPEMRERAVNKAAQYTWERYAEAILGSEEAWGPAESAVGVGS